MFPRPLISTLFPYTTLFRSYCWGCCRNCWRSWCIYTRSNYDCCFKDSNTNDYCKFTRDYFHFRSEEHTSELQSRGHLVCRLLLEKKKKWQSRMTSSVDNNKT